jgi:hypothetical protein
MFRKYYGRLDHPNKLQPVNKLLHMKGHLYIMNCGRLVNVKQKKHSTYQASKTWIAQNQWHVLGGASKQEVSCLRSMRMTTSKWHLSTATMIVLMSFAASHLV